MRAALLTAPKTFKVVDAPVPEPGPGELLVRVEGCGICGSNLAPWQGAPWFEYPFQSGAPGHEGWGEIEKTGPGASQFTPGERVAFLSERAFAEYDLVRAEKVVRLPPSLEKKPVPAEALGCAFNVFRRAGIRPDETVAIVGIGFLGALLTSLATQWGARVIAIARRPFALEIARHFGAAHLVAMDDHQRITDEVRQLTGGRGCDCVIEAVGLQWPLDLSAELTRERGRLIIAGYHQDGPRQVNMQLWNWRGLDVVNAHERDPQIYIQGMREAVEALASGRLNPAPLYTHSFTLENISQGFKALEERPANFLKALVTL